MPDPNRKSEEEKGDRVPIALQVPSSDPSKLEEEEIGVPEKREYGRNVIDLVCVVTHPISVAHHRSLS